MPSKYPRAGRIVNDDEATMLDEHDASSRTQFWERSARPVPAFEGTFAEGTNPPRAPEKRLTTRDETAPLD